MSALALSGCLVEGIGDDGEPVPYAAEACNGHRALCDRRFDEVAFAVTHNSFATGDRFTTGFYNQNRRIATQLEDGIRGFMLDTYWHKPWFKSARAALCHKWCTTGGYIDLVPELASIDRFLDARPNEVVTLMIEPHSLSPAQFEDAMRDAGLLSRVYVHPSPSSAWPTLRELIDDDTRVVVFYENEPGEAAAGPGFYHPLWDNAWETPFSASSVADFSCDRNRGTAGAQLYLVNHFLSAPAGRPDLAPGANAWPVLDARVRACETRQLPNFVAVDFYELDDDAGDGVDSVVRAVDYLNGID